MAKILNINLREMAPFERHEKIFGMLDSLKEGEILRITNDHEPKPLFYMLEGEYPGKFNWEYEKQGPKDWIFKIKKNADSKDKSDKIKDLIKKLHNKEDLKKHKAEARDLLKNISSKDLGLIEQEIINEGITRKEMRKLCDVHLDIMKENICKKDLNLKPGHPIHTLMEEHKEILDFIEGLKEINTKAQISKNYSDFGTINIQRLEFISKHLVEADKHHQREEDVLFPAMEKKGVIEPPEIMKEEHIELKAKKKELYKLSRSVKKLSFNEFKKKLKEISDFLIEELPNHIYKEDNILYPMAIEVIPEKDWKNIKSDCDRIGYCCFSPVK